MPKAQILALAALVLIVPAHAFCTSRAHHVPVTHLAPSASASSTKATCLGAVSRRLALQDAAKKVAAASVVVVASPFIGINPAVAETAAATDAPVEMKLFTDESFTLTLPKRFFALRRRAKGDLPDEKTGQGRRGSTLFNAGDLAKAEVIAVERFPVKVLLEEAGVSPDAIVSADLSTIQKLGSAETIAELLALRRDKDKPGSGNRSIVQKDSVKISEDGKTLQFALRANIEVQKPDELFKQMGVYGLYRDSLCKATLESEDGNMLAVFASALEQDFEGPDGVALRQSVDSFRALKQAQAQ